MFFGEVELPQAPEKVETVISGNNRTLYLISGEQISLLQKPQLTEIRFELVLPSVWYPWVRPDRAQPVEYLAYFDELLQAQAPFYWSFTRLKQDGEQLFYTCMPVTLEAYTVVDAAEDGLDLRVQITLRQWRDYGTKVYTADGTAGTDRDSSTSPASTVETTYTVQTGDSLWNIAKKYLGDGSRWTEIAALNAELIDDPDLIYAGQVLVLPGSQ